MARCFVTGVQISLDESWALDVSEVHRAIRGLKSQLAALEGLLTQLGDRDEVHLKDYVTGRERIRKDCRLVCASVAVAMGGVCPGRPIFVQFREWKRLKEQRRAWIERKVFTGQSGAGEMPDEGTDCGDGSSMEEVPVPKDRPAQDGRCGDHAPLDVEGGDFHGQDRIWDAGDFR